MGNVNEGQFTEERKLDILNRSEFYNRSPNYIDKQNDKDLTPGKKIQIFNENYESKEKLEDFINDLHSAQHKATTYKYEANPDRVKNEILTLTENIQMHKRFFKDLDLKNENIQKSEGISFTCKKQRMNSRIDGEMQEKVYGKSAQKNSKNSNVDVFQSTFSRMDASTTRTPVKSIVLPEKLKELEDLEIQKPVSQHKQVTQNIVKIEKTYEYYQNEYKTDITSQLLDKIQLEIGRFKNQAKASKLEQFDHDKIQEKKLLESEIKDLNRKTPKSKSSISTLRDSQTFQQSNKTSEYPNSVSKFQHLKQTSNQKFYDSVITSNLHNNEIKSKLDMISKFNFNKNDDLLNDSNSSSRKSGQIQKNKTPKIQRNDDKIDNLLDDTLEKISNLSMQIKQKNSSSLENSMNSQVSLRQSGKIKQSNDKNFSFKKDDDYNANKDKIDNILDSLNKMSNLSIEFDDKSAKKYKPSYESLQIQEIEKKFKDHKENVKQQESLFKKQQLEDDDSFDETNFHTFNNNK